MSDVMPEESKPKERKTAHPLSRKEERPRLSERRKDILKFCHKYAECKGWAVSIQEIAKEFEITYHSAEYDLQQLDKLNYLIFEGSRQIKVLCLP
jgi:Mn-dependent DtxR family transcriptional regulator